MEIMTQIALVLLCSIATLVLLSGLWVLLTLVLAEYNLGVMYLKFESSERAALVTENGKIVRILHNSLAYVLVECNEPGFELGKMIPIGEYRGQKVLNHITWYEDWLKVRWIGWPMVQSLHRTKLRWWGVGDGNRFAFHERWVNQYAVTKLFGFVMPELNVGSDEAKDGKPRQQADMIPVTLKYIGQVYMENPVHAITRTDWVAGTVLTASPYVQQQLGDMDLTELARIHDSKSADNQLTKAFKDNLNKIELFGVRFVKDTVSYVDYELSGPIKAVVETAMIELYKARQDASSIAVKQEASMTAARARESILKKMTEDLTAKNFSEQAISAIISGFLLVESRGAFRGDILVEGGSNAKVPITVSGKKGGT